MAEFAVEVDREVDIPSAQLLQYLGFLAELCAGELVDDHRAVAQLFELAGKGIGGNAIGGGMRLA
jgi:hypothetical protein